MSKHLLCIAASFNREHFISGLIPGSLFPIRYVTDESHVEDILREPKESGKSIVLVALGPAGRKAIEYLCDDYDRTDEDRRVKWIHSVSAGIDWYNIKDNRKAFGAIPLTTGRGAYSFHLGAHVLTSILYFNSQIVRFQTNRAAKKWEVFPMREITGLKVGLLGYGDIGRETAKVLTPLRLSLTGVRRSPSSEEVDDLGVRQACGAEAMDRVIRESDFVVNILPGTAETAGLFNRDTFEKMKKDAVYINIGRGMTQVDTELAAVLQEGVIAGAAVDVYQEEPLPPSSPLWEIPDEKILLTPHNVCVTDESFPNAVRLFVRQAEEFVKTDRVTGYRANLDTGY